MQIELTAEQIERLKVLVQIMTGKPIDDIVITHITEERPCNR